MAKIYYLILITVCMVLITGCMEKNSIEPEQARSYLNEKVSINLTLLDSQKQNETLIFKIPTETTYSGEIDGVWYSYTMESFDLKSENYNIYVTEEGLKIAAKQNLNINNQKTEFQGYIRQDIRGENYIDIE